MSSLPGIINTNEFYSAHYLESILVGDIKKVYKRWTDEANIRRDKYPLEDVSTPDQRFKRLRNSWQKLHEAEHSAKKNLPERLRLQRELFFQPLCEALGYKFKAVSEPALIGGEAYQIPLIGEVKNDKGDPYLWLVECFNPTNEGIDPLDLSISNTWMCQINDPSLGYVLEDETWELLIGKRIFGQDSPPRWVIAVSRDQLLLIDRQKWASSRLLRFDLEVLFGEYNPDALMAATTLLHKEHTCPTNGGIPYLDDLDENSHKHAYEVSDDLKYALRRSIELIGNEAIYWRKARNEGVFKGKTDAEQLTIECLRYMYRILFVFYIESRPELGYSPMGSDIYRLGYSLESLRDMDSVQFSFEEDKESFFISDSLDRLFLMIWEGYPKRDDPNKQILLVDEKETFYDSFRLTPLRSHLFDPDRLPTLTRVRFRNCVMREVIELMSLSRSSKGKRRGRVSYSQLGINQLGAVYEALLSFRGFFAEEDLFEVKPAPKKGKNSIKKDKNDNSSNAISSKNNDLKVGYFINSEQLKAYKKEEIVVNSDNGNPKSYPKGSFIYRLAGRDREKSASYYTPESLTKCLVKNALAELLPGKTAAEILNLKICEPAMGSAAFLNEVVNQLANAYLERRQSETGNIIPHESYVMELQKVKMRLADQNVFGADLNPVAVELAEVSLWLNSIFSPEKGRAFVPWFSQQLVCGNSLIGARRQIYRVSQLPTKKGKNFQPKKLWYENAPEELAWGSDLPEDGIFHFLLPDPGMMAYNDKVIKLFEKEAIECCQKWQRNFCQQVFTDSQISHMRRLSKLVDSLWRDWVVQQELLRERTTDPLTVWQDPSESKDFEWTSLKLKDRIQQQEVQGIDVANTNARLRLKWVMDYWVALWFWPIKNAHSLPSRDSWLMELSMILGDLEQGLTPELGQQNLFAETQSKQIAIDFFDNHGFVDIEKLKAEFKSLKIVEEVVNRNRPLHWDLEFADLLKKGGFDLIIGNPPWLKIEWEEKGVISDADPMVLIRKVTASDLVKRREDALIKNPKLLKAYLEEFVEQTGKKNFISSSTNYQLLKGTQNNLYKCFLPNSWRIASNNGVQGFLHPEGVYDDPKAGLLRSVLYGRLRKHFQFQNELRLFPIEHGVKYSLNIYGPSRQPSFIHLANLFHPKTIDACFSHDGKGRVGGIKTDDKKWNMKGHRYRLIDVDEKQLALFAKLYDEPNTPHCQARLPILHSQQYQRVLKKISDTTTRLGDLKNYLISEMMDESKDVSNGTIKRYTCFPEKSKDLIFSGPHFFAGLPFYKTPRRKCTLKSDYDCIDLITLPENYLPRTNYITELSEVEYLSRVPIVPWEKKKRVTNFYRLISRKMLNQVGERTLISSIIPPGMAHINGCISQTYSDTVDLINIASLFCSIPFDFFIKTTGRSNLYKNTIEQLPLLSDNHSRSVRILALNCLTKYYANLWNESWKKEFKDQKWSKKDPRLDNSFFSNLQLNWQRDFALRNDYSRRQAMLEIDVLVAQALGMSLDELIMIYQVQFPTMQQNEGETFYDKNGRIVFTANKGLTGIGLPRKGKGFGNNKEIGWEDIADIKSGNIEVSSVDDTLSFGPVERTIKYEAPFDRCNRVEDYIMAWNFFKNVEVQ